MSIVVENLEVKPETTSASASGQQSPQPPLVLSPRPNPVEIEKTLRRVLERLARVWAS
jgi:hypothetical protein